MIIVPFAQPLGNSGGPGNDGVLHASIAKVDPIVVLSTAASGANTLVLKGDATGASITWDDHTTHSNDFDVDPHPIFNTSDDTYMLELVPGDIIESINWLVDTAGDYSAPSGTVDVWYRDNAGALVEQLDIPLPDFTSTGIVTVTLPTAIDAGNVGFLDDPRNTRTRFRSIVVDFKNIDSVTTAPIAIRMWKKRSPSAPRNVTTFTSLITEEDKTPYDAVKIFPLEGDVTLIGAASPWSASYIEVLRERSSDLGATQTVVSTGTSGGEVDLLDVPDENLLLQSGDLDDFWNATGTFVDRIIPPSAWAPGVVSVDEVDHNLYWYGWRYTSDSTQPALVLEANMTLQVFDTANGNTGFTMTEDGTFELFELFTRDPDPDEDSTFLLTNLTEGSVVNVTVAAGEVSSSSAISMTYSEGDIIAIQQVTGSGLNSIADGFIRIT